MSKKNKGLEKEIRINFENVSVRAEGESEKMVVEGYPIVFGEETFIYEKGGFFEKVDRNAFDGADMDDVALKYNHNDNVFLMARTRNGSLTLTPDDHGVFMHAELIDTETNKDVYKMVRSGLLTEGSFAFTVEDETEEMQDGQRHRTIKKVGTLFDVSICPWGAYGDRTEIFARKRAALESAEKEKAEALRRVAVLRLKNKNKMKLYGGNYEN